MNNFNNVNLLEIIESYATENNLLDSEQAVTDSFNETVLPEILKLHGEPGIEFNDDVMINEEFSTFKDDLCKSGYLHTEQYNNYCYLGNN